MALLRTDKLPKAKKLLSESDNVPQTHSPIKTTLTVNAPVQMNIKHILLSQLMSGCTYVYNILASVCVGVVGIIYSGFSA